MHTTTVRPRAAVLLLALCALLLVGGCARVPSATPRVLPPDDVIRAAQQRLTDRCLTHQGLTPPRAGQRPGTTRAAMRRDERVSDALFGAGRTELSHTLPTGYSVRAHTDGCLAAAQQTLYGDQRRWFHVSTVVNNLKPEAAHRHRDLASVRALHRTELADWRRLRAHALARSKSVLRASPNVPSPHGDG
ncbi:hypothetical protein [Streptomyces formicae]|uniref:Lipoprotein n=1 Tax=Streptomyces formicae TaxID=1616117 RepID=A0A291Q7N5_9ACTN|nr:hypothetical protein [Streptomyces formicae]ATL27444.1 hypothetical protein KY5_2426 [Streptomyces formicae]